MNRPGATLGSYRSRTYPSRVTLVLTAFTQDLVVQVSDRSLSQKGVPLAETRTKTVVWGPLMFGMSGLAEIEGERSDMWLAARLSEISVGAPDPLERLTTKATQAFSQVRLDWRRHAFVAAGWRRGRPVLATISNCLDAQGGQLARAERVFTLRTYQLPETAVFETYAIGAAIPENSTTELKRLGRRVAERTNMMRGGAGAVVRLLVDRVRRIANVEPTVGDSLMVGVYPRGAPPVTSLSFPPRENEAAFFYLPSPGHNTPMFYMPALATPGMAVAGGEIWLNQRPPWWRD
jgi:hypothetical protein